MDPYSAIVQFLIHAEQISWNRFNNFLLGNSFLILAWAAIYDFKGDAYSGIITFVLITICVIGGFTGILFAFLGYRGREFLKEYKEMGAKIEADVTLWPEKFREHKVFTESQFLTQNIPFKGDKRVIIVFLDDLENSVWDKAVAEDFLKGYSEKDAAYDKQ